jgi:MFS superfamily sulfate permease-like transporter
MDLVGLSLSNIAAAFTGTFVVNGSPTKTEMVENAYGRSQVAQLTTTAIVLLVLLFLTGPLTFMPSAALAAVVFLIGVRLVDVKGMARIAKLRRGEFAVALITAVAVVFIGVEVGIVLAIVLSIIAHLSHSYRPTDRLLVQVPGGHWHAMPLESDARAAPNLVVYRFGSSLYYANASRFAGEILGLVSRAKPPLTCVIVAASAIGDIDYSAYEMIARLHARLAELGVKLVLADLEREVRDELARYGLTKLLGADCVYADLSDAVDAYRDVAPAR